MVLSDSIFQECPDNGSCTGSYILVYQGVQIDYCTHVPGPVAQSTSESEYCAACTSVMALANFQNFKQ